MSYSAQDAATAYQKRGDFIEVRIKVFFTPSYTSAAADFWRDFSIGLIQKEHMAATSVRGQPIYESDEDGGGPLIGADVYARFSIVGVKSSAIQVEVIPPQGAPVHATFDLSNLR